MNEYTNFAAVYDELMDDIPYDDWAAFTMQVLRGSGVPDGSAIAEIGCGTGAFTMRLARAGYDMTAVDLSSDMLSVAYNKAADEGLSVQFVCQDMRELDLPGRYPAIVSFCDCLNYILDETELYNVFSRVFGFLEEGGCFFFDFNTRYKYETVMKDEVIAENREDVSFIWENCCDRDEHINEYDVTFFVRDSESGDPDVFRRFEEIHLQKGYEWEDIRKMLERAGLSPVRTFDEYTGAPSSDTSERICVLAVKDTRKEQKFNDGEES